MLNVSVVAHVVEKGLRRAMPERDSLVEACGYLLLGYGLFLGLAAFSYDPNDYLLNDYSPEKITNLAGPVGAWFAHQVLGFFGVVGMTFPVLFSVWGGLIIFGFAVVPAPKRISGLFLFMMVLAAFVEVQFQALALAEPSFGYGGRIGAGLSEPMLRALGFGGTSLCLIMMGFLALVLTGNLALSQTKSFLIFGFVKAKGFLKKTREFMQDDFLTDEEIIKQALREEIRVSKSLRTGGGASGDAAPVARNRSSGNEAVSLEPRGKRPRKKTKSTDPSAVNLQELTDDVVGEMNAGIEKGDGDATIDFHYTGKSHGKPNSGLFSRSSPPKDRAKEFAAMAEKLAAQLEQFKVEGKVKKIVEGPVVTTFEFEPVPGTKVSKITGLAKDLARMLQASSLRILAPIPGKKVVGFEVPNAERRMIGFADLVEHRNLKSTKVSLPVAMGVDAFGKVVIEDLAKMPHLLVAGSTGSGKSVFMNTLIGGLIARHSAKDLRFIMIDPKMVELAAYNDLPHMATSVITDPAGEAKEKLDALVIEMESRFNRMRLVGARNIDGFNEIIKKGKKSSYPQFEDKWQTMPYIVLIIDELADMMMVLGKDAEMPITRLAQKARAAGIHMVIATQRPSAEVVTGLIKANFPTRVAFRVLSGLDSRTILDTSGAEGLIGQGDMLFLNAAGLRRMHGAYLSDSEVSKMVKACKK